MTEKLLREILARLESIQQDIRDLPRIQAAHFFLMEEEVRKAQRQGLQASDIYEITDGSLSGNTHVPAVSEPRSTEDR